MTRKSSKKPQPSSKKIIEKDDFTYLMGDFTEEKGLWFQFDVPFTKLPEIMEDQFDSKINKQLKAIISS